MESLKIHLHVLFSLFFCVFVLFFHPKKPSLEQLVVTHIPLRSKKDIPDWAFSASPGALPQDVCHYHLNLKNKHLMKLVFS